MCCLYTYIPTYIHTYVHTYIHTLHYIALHCIALHSIPLHYITYLHTYIHTDIHTYVRTYVHTYIYIYIDINMYHTVFESNSTYDHMFHIYTFKHTYIHIYIYRGRSRLFKFKCMCVPTRLQPFGIMDSNQNILMLTSLSCPGVCVCVWGNNNDQRHNLCLFSFELQQSS